jgi:hypothetical protein
MGNIWLGSKDMFWLGKTIEKAVITGLVGELFRHHHSGYKAIHFIHRSNQCSVLCKRYWNTQNLSKDHEIESNNDRHRMATGVAVPRKEEEGRKSLITHRDTNFKNHVTDAVNKAVGVMSISMPEGDVNACVQLNFNLELVCGSGGKCWILNCIKLGF